MLVRQYVGTQDTCSPLMESQYVGTQVIYACSRNVVSTLVRWYANDTQSSDRTLVHKNAGHSQLPEKCSQYVSTQEKYSPLIELQYVGKQVIHACSRGVVSTLVRWYASDMESSDRTLVDKDAGHSWLSEKCSQCASTLVRQ